MKADIVFGKLILTPESLTEENCLERWKNSALTSGYLSNDRYQMVYEIGEHSIEVCKFSDRCPSHESEQSSDHPITGDISQANWVNLDKRQTEGEK